MSIKLVAIDIDGTLLNDHHQITNEVKTAIKQANEKGVTVVLCTGRPLPGVQDQLAELALFAEDDYVITYNGSLVQNTKSGAVISQHGVTLNDYMDIELEARKVGVHLHAINAEAIYTSNRNISPYTIHEAYLVKMPLKYRTVEEFSEEMNLIKVMMIDEPERLDAAIAKLPEALSERFTTVKSTPFYYEILNKEASKGNALARLAQHLKIDVSEVMAIGDNDNDLSMLEYAGLAVAMGNGTDAVKAAADVVTSSNNEHGVAQAINKYILEA